MITRKILGTLCLSLLFTLAASAQGRLAEEADMAFDKGFY